MSDSMGGVVSAVNYVDSDTVQGKSSLIEFFDLIERVIRVPSTNGYVMTADGSSDKIDKSFFFPIKKKYM